MFWFLWLAVSQLCHAAEASLTYQVDLGGIGYFLPPRETRRLEGWQDAEVPGADEFVPLTVVTLDGAPDADSVAAALQKYGEEDDVWSPAFTEVLYLQSQSEFSRTATDEMGKGLESTYNISAILSPPGSVTADSRIPSGPYFVQRHTGNIYQAYRLYRDYNQAFIVSSYQDQDGRHHTVPAAIETDAGLTMAVPSRLYFRKTADKPLAGLRIGIKDLFDLKGLRTGGGNKALYSLSSPADESAVAVQKLVDAGAVIVGKNKLSEFAFGGSFSSEHLDYLVPTNPRGDGYRVTSDSSHGSAAAMASYPWLDASLGSDTGGSIRGPVGNNGVHGNRPSLKTVSLKGAIPLSTSFDTAGIIVRDPVLWGDIVKVLCDDELKEFDQYPSKIYIAPTTDRAITEYKETQPELAAAMTGFLDTLKEITSGSVDVFAVDTVWEENTPDEAPDGLYLGFLLRGIYQNFTAYEQWTEFGEDFSEKYKRANGGKFPYMVPSSRAGWFNARDNYNDELYQQDLRYTKVFSKWADEHTLRPDEKTCSDALFVYFLTPDSPAFHYKADMSIDLGNIWIADLVNRERENKLQALTLNVTLQCDTHIGTNSTCGAARGALENAQEPFEKPDIFSAVASIAGFPDFAMTLGSIDIGDASRSNATLQNQKLPLAVDLVAARGCDFMLTSLIKELAARGAVRHVRTGEVA